MKHNCLDCSLVATTTEELKLFATDKAMKLGVKSLCKPCSNTRNRITRAKHLDKRRDEAYRKKYGITLSIYNKMYKEQEGKCKICSTTNTERLYVDHCHTTARVRGLLCHNCNTGLGHFKDNTLLLLQAIQYLK